MLEKFNPEACFISFLKENRIDLEMVFTFIFEPNWFLAPDVIINTFSFLVLLTFFILCIRSYRLTKNKAILYLGWGFAFIAFAQLSLDLTKFALYHITTLTSYVGEAIIKYNIVNSTNTAYNIGIALNKVLTLLGIYVIYRLPQKKKSATDFFLVLYFIVLSVFISNEMYYLFHVTALILFSLVAYNYYSLYKKSKFSNTKILSVAFSLLAISQLMFIFYKIGIVNVLADTVQLASYIILLVLIIRIMRHGNKKKQDGYNLGYAEHNPGKRRKH